jgi:hypothetical protein
MLRIRTNYEQAEMSTVQDVTAVACDGTLRPVETKSYYRNEMINPETDHIVLSFRNQPFFRMVRYLVHRKTYLVHSFITAF